MKKTSKERKGVSGFRFETMFLDHRVKRADVDHYFTYERDLRRSKQIDKFGRALTMFVLGQVLDFEVVPFEYSAADFIATNSRSKLAVLVQTRVLRVNDKSGFIPFDKHLSLWADAPAIVPNVMPTVAFVMLYGGGRSRRELEAIDLYLIPLDALVRYANADDAQAFGIRFNSKEPRWASERKPYNGYYITTGKRHQKFLDTQPDIFHYKLEAPRFAGDAEKDPRNVFLDTVAAPYDATDVDFEKLGFIRVVPSGVIWKNREGVEFTQKELEQFKFGVVRMFGRDIVKNVHEITNQDIHMLYEEFHQNQVHFPFIRQCYLHTRGEYGGTHESAVNCVEEQLVTHLLWL